MTKKISFAEFCNIKNSIPNAERCAAFHSKNEYDVTLRWWNKRENMAKELRLYELGMGLRGTWKAIVPLELNEGY